MGLTFVSATPSQGTCVNTPPVTCSLGAIAGGGTASVTIVATAPSAGSFVNPVSVTATETDQDPSNNAASVTTVVATNTLNADVSVSKAGNPATVALGTIGVNVTYTLTVTNSGPQSATGVTLSDALPAGMTYISAAPSQGSCTGTAIVTCDLGVMANGGSATVTIVAMNTSVGTKANMATVSNTGAAEYDPNLINNAATATTTVTGGAAPLCVVPGKDGAGGTLSGVVNTYYPGTASVAAGVLNTCIAVGASRGSATLIANGDLLLVIQMQDADIDSTNTGNYGGATGTGAGATAVNAGKYEFVRAMSAVGTGGCAAGQVPITGSGANNGLLNSYANSNATAAKGQARFQVVRVPQYSTATLNGVTAAPWVTNTAAPIGLGTGGVLAIDVAGTLTVNTGVAASVDGQGFRGAAGRQLTGGGPATNTDYRNPSTVTTHGGKGEGGAGTPRWIFDPNGSHPAAPRSAPRRITTSTPSSPTTATRMVPWRAARRRTRAAARPTATPAATTRTPAAAAGATAALAAAAASPGAPSSTTAASAQRSHRRSRSSSSAAAAVPARATTAIAAAMARRPPRRGSRAAAPRVAD